MVHVSGSCNPVFHTTASYRLNADMTAFMQFLTSDPFRDFPTLKFVIPHVREAVPYRWGRFRGLAQDIERPPLRELLLQNFFSTPACTIAPESSCCSRRFRRTISCSPPRWSARCAVSTRKRDITTTTRGATSMRSIR